jgi:hypothetical protein
MSNTAASKAATVAAKIAGQAATIGAHGVPVGPLVEAVVGELLGELITVQDEQLVTLRNIERDVAQLVEGPYRTAREMLEKAMIPGRSRKAVKADLQTASNEFLRAAAQYRDATLSQASAYMEASLVLGLLGDLSAMRHYGDKAWKESVAVLRRDAQEATSFLGRSKKKLGQRRENSFWSRAADAKYAAQFARMCGGLPEEDLAETKRIHKTKRLSEIFPEARAIEQVHETKRQVGVYRDVAANVSDGPDVLPHLEVWADLPYYPGSTASPWVGVEQAYHREQLESRRDEFAALVRRLGIDEHLFVGLYGTSETFLDCLTFRTLSDTDPRVVAFQTEVDEMFPYGLLIISADWRLSRGNFQLV